jgi:hypothetical protein
VEQIIWKQIILPYCTVGVGILDGRVVETGGINRWMRGKTLPEVEGWVRGKRGTVIDVPVDDPQ